MSYILILCAHTHLIVNTDIIAGAYRLTVIREHHADIREWEHEKAVAAHEEATKKKKWLAKDEMRYLMKVRDCFSIY